MDCCAINQYRATTWNEIILWCATCFWSGQFVLMATPAHGATMTDRVEKTSERSESAGEKDSTHQDDDVIRIEDLAPPTDVKGGRKILLGEMPTPTSTPRIRPGS